MSNDEDWYRHVGKLVDKIKESRAGEGAPSATRYRSLSDAITYFDERADADHVDAIGRAEGNEEMRLRDGLMRLREKLAGEAR